MKNKYGTTVLVNMIDEYIVSKEVKNNDEAKEELYTCVLLKCGFSIRVIESVEEVYNKIQRIYNSTI